MSEWTTLITGILLELIEFGIYLILEDTFFVNRRSRLVTAGVSLLFFGVNHVLVEICPSMLLREAAIILMFVLLTVFLYQAKWIPCIFTAILYMALLNVSDVIVLYGFAVFSGQSPADLQLSPELYLMASYLAKIFGLLVVSLLHAWGSAFFQHKPQRVEHYLKFGMYPLSTLISALLMYSAAIQAPQIAPVLLFCVIFLLVTDFLTVFLLGQFEQQQEKLNHSYLLHQQLGAAMDNIAAATESYENERKLTHDFQNHLTVIRGMLEGNAERSEIVSYLDQTAQYTTSASLSITTNRSAADVLFNQKYAVARQKGIAFQVRLDDLSGFPLPDNALVVLLSNLLDNAIEACDRMPDGTARWILVKMSVGKEECLLSMENAVSAPVEIDHNQIRTTKADSTRHGYGMRNIHSIVDAYDGYCTMKCDEKSFRFAATFPGVQSERI